MDPLSCGWDTATFLIFSDNVFAPLIYYSHLGPLVASLLIGIAVLVNNPRALVNRALFVMTAAFAVWVYADLVLWASEKPEYIMFFWSAMAPIELLIYAAGWYLVVLLSNRGSEPSFREKIVAAAAFLPVFLLAHTSYALLGYDLTNCDREPIEGPLWQYIYFVEVLFIGWILAKAIRGYRRMKDPAERKQLALVATGVILSLLVFSAGNFAVLFLLDVDWSYEQYKLFGMPVLAAFITYSAIRFRTFDLKVFTAQALVIALALLVFSLLFLRSIENVRIITIVTFALVCALGWFLVRNVRREIEQRMLIEKQEKELEVANKQQESLLHFISHEVKGYLTESQAGFASIVEGDFGAVPDKLKTMAGGALASVRRGVSTVMDLLDASNFKKGTMTFAKNEFDLRKAVREVVGELKKSADEKGLTIDLAIGEGAYMFTGDEDKIRRHVVRNLIDNAIKYTPRGAVRVELTDGDKLHFKVRDSGVGITPEDMQNLFTEGGHGKDSIKVNVHSTGYGLFIAKQIVDAHGGKIWAESQGEGKGSAFIVEFPIAS
ncbi:hypothetical protein HYW59_02740 [Candidatus Kaiserbacteria bacterium]|nr:hypothetical protein [Candidatus Kaiserbacteria bacterium]